MHVDFLRLLESLRQPDTPVCASDLGRCATAFIKNEWASPVGHLTHVMVPVLDGEAEVEVEIDEVAGIYRYRSLQHRGRVVSRSLSEIAVFSCNVDQWLVDLAALMGIEQRRLAKNTVRVANHLWHLGDLRIQGTHDFAPIFVGVQLSRSPHDQLARVLGDPVWQMPGVIFVHGMAMQHQKHGHAVRGLAEFCNIESESENWDTLALDRLLRGFANRCEEPEPQQYFNGTRIKLPHFPMSRELAPERARIMKVMWGGSEIQPPILSWAEVNEILGTGYQSFEDALGSRQVRDEYLERVSRGRYRIRRSALNKP